MPVTPAHWEAAARAAGGAAELRPLLGGPAQAAWSVQLAERAVVVSCPALGTVLTAADSLRAEVDHELWRLLPEAAGRPPAAWWTEAWAPWGPAGAVGVGIARALAAALAGAAHAAEGI
ncbi:MAG: hypothetical protein LBD51_10400 [Bifidobacteriaceae bacterium]|nr:hypothetical protein [Bifidobacteriaceae bacterium]